MKRVVYNKEINNLMWIFLTFWDYILGFLGLHHHIGYILKEFGEGRLAKQFKNKFEKNICGINDGKPSF